MKKILFLPKYYEEGPSSRYRTFNYLKYFRENGVDYDVKPLMEDGYVKRLYKGMSKTEKLFYIIKAVLKRILFLVVKAKKYDLLIIEKELFPNLPYFFEKLLLRGKKYTLDFDDAIFSRYQNKILFKDKINKLSQNSELTTVGNKWYFSQIKSNKLMYLPTVINIDNYPKKNKKENKIPTIVWIGSPKTVKYLKKLDEVFKKLSKNFEFKLKIIGANYKLEGVNIECLDWSEKTEFNELHSSDIGIMPLEKTYWENGKCGFKLIQYMASEVACIGDNLPANKEIINSNKVGFIVDSLEEWEEKLKRLLKNSLLRENIAKNGRKRIINFYTYQIKNKEYIGKVTR